jgi:hypothetical protein
MKSVLEHHEGKELVRELYGGAERANRLLIIRDARDARDDVPLVPIIDPLAGREGAIPP